MKRLLLIGPTLLVAILLSATLLAANARADILAVLPLNANNAEMDPSARQMLEESIRTTAGDVLSPRGYTVLTGDNTLQVLADNGLDPAKACEASCALAAAREMKASLFIAGVVSKTEGWYYVFVRLFDQKDGRQLTSVKLEAQTVRDLEKQFEQKAPDFFARGLGEIGASGRGQPDRPIKIERKAPPPISSGACQAGQERTAASQGQCCWPNQVWGDGRCRGVPNCPDKMASSGETCIVPDCGPGMRRMGDEAICCYDGQVAAAGVCRGTPSGCPFGSKPQGETCVEDSAAPSVLPKFFEAIPGALFAIGYGYTYGPGKRVVAGTEDNPVMESVTAIIHRPSFVMRLGLGPIELSGRLGAVTGTIKPTGSTAGSVSGSSTDGEYTNMDLSVSTGVQLISWPNFELNEFSWINLSLGAEVGLAPHLGAYAAETIKLSCFLVRAQYDYPLVYEGVSSTWDSKAGWYQPGFSIIAGYNLDGCKD